MTNTVKEVLEFVKENDVKFIRLAFCDLFGVQKNISVMANELPRAFEEGISFDACAISGFSDVTRSDLFLFPDAATLNLLPWRPQEGRVMRFYCDIKTADGNIFPCDTRSILKNAVKRCDEMGYSCKIGTECEFYLFKTDDNGDPTDIPLDRGSYFDIAPLDRGENIRREICLCLEEMGLEPETSHHEQGPGQNEIDFRFSDTLSSADNLITFKSVVKAIAARNGLFASFMPKPICDASGSGLHINMSLSQNGINIFKNIQNEHSQVVSSFIAGVLSRTAEMTAILNPTVNSYERLGSFEAPKYISWSNQNRSQLIRIPAASGEKVRMELRSPDPSSNPYLAFALLINAGLAGIKDELKSPEAVDLDLYNSDIPSALKMLPQSLADSLEIMKKSDFVRECLGDEAFNRYITIKDKEVDDFFISEDKEGFYKQYFKF